MPPDDFRSGVIAAAGVFASANFMPAVGSIAAGNIIDTAKQFKFSYGNGAPLAKGALIRILSAVVKVDASALISGEGAYTLHGYSVTPPSARASNAAWARATGDLDSYRGAIAIGTPAAAGGTCYVKAQLTDVQDFQLSGDSLFCELVNAGTFVGVAKARAVELYGVVL